MDNDLAELVVRHLDRIATNLESAAAPAGCEPTITVARHNELMRVVIDEKNVAECQRDQAIAQRDSVYTENARISEQRDEARRERDAAYLRTNTNASMVYRLQQQLDVLRKVVEWAIALYPDAYPSNPVKDRLTDALASAGASEKDGAA